MCSSEIDPNASPIKGQVDDGLGGPRASTLTNFRARIWVKSCYGQQGLRRRPLVSENVIYSLYFSPPFFTFPPFPIFNPLLAEICPLFTTLRSSEVISAPPHGRTSENLKHLHRISPRSGASPHTRSRTRLTPSGCLAGATSRRDNKNR